MIKVLVLAIFCLSCTSNKTAKQEFNDTADQVDNGVRNIIKEVKKTATGAAKKMSED